MRMERDLKELLLAFNRHHVRYLLIGGYAFGVYSEPRATKDLDVFISTDERNSLAVFAALADFGAPLSGLGPEDFRDGSTFQMGQPPHRIDILQRIDGVDFEDAWQSRVQTLVNGEIPVPVISSQLLIQNKLAAGRPQDLLDVKVMNEAAQQRREPQEP